MASPIATFTLALRVGFGFGRNPLSGRPFLGPQGLTSGGAVALRTFADDNANGRLDEGEAPLRGGAFFAGTEEQRSDSDGRAFLGHLGDGNRASIRVDADSMPDIALAPARPGVEDEPFCCSLKVEGGRPTQLQGEDPERPAEPPARQDPGR